MLTPAQYEAIGRLTLGFNEIEFVFECYTAALLGTPELRLSLALTEDGSFHQKASRFRRVLFAILEEYPGLYTPVNWVLELLVAARAFAENRNGYVHALVTEDFPTNQTLLRVRGTAVRCDEAEINRTALDVIALVAQIHERCGDLIVALQDARRLV